MEALEYINEYIHWAKFHVKVYATVKRMLITKSYIKVDFKRITIIFRCTIYLLFSLSKFSTPWSYCYHSCCFTINIKQNRKIYYALNEWKKVSLHIIMTIFLYQYAPSFSLIWTKRLRFTMNHPKHYFKVETHLTLEIVQIFQRFFQMHGEWFINWFQKYSKPLLANHVVRISMKNYLY